MASDRAGSVVGNRFVFCWSKICDWFEQRP